MISPTTIPSLRDAFPTAAEPAGEAQRIYLHPGQLLVAQEPCLITTILGSCVSVCLWDSVLRVGAINHFLLPKFTGDGTASARYGDIAIGESLDRLWELGSRKQDLTAKLFGGACVLEAFRDRQHHLGQKNIEIAQELLAAAAIPVIGQDIGGQRGRKLIFRSDDGSAWVKQL